MIKRIGIALALVLVCSGAIAQDTPTETYTNTPTHTNTPTRTPTFSRNGLIAAHLICATQTPVCESAKVEIGQGAVAVALRLHAGSPTIKCMGRLWPGWGAPEIEFGSKTADNDVCTSTLPFYDVWVKWAACGTCDVSAWHKESIQ